MVIFSVKWEYNEICISRFAGSDDMSVWVSESPKSIEMINRDDQLRLTEQSSTLV